MFQRMSLTPLSRLMHRFAKLSYITKKYSQKSVSLLWKGETLMDTMEASSVLFYDPHKCQKTRLKSVPWMCQLLFGSVRTVWANMFCQSLSNRLYFSRQSCSVHVSDCIYIYIYIYIYKKKK